MCVCVGLASDIVSKNTTVLHSLALYCEVCSLQKWYLGERAAMLLVMSRPTKFLSLYPRTERGPRDTEEMVSMGTVLRDSRLLLAMKPLQNKFQKLTNMVYSCFKCKCNMTRRLEYK